MAGVLLADDQDIILTALQRFLAPSCEIVGRVSAAKAVLEATIALAPDVVVLDMVMPEVSGLEFCREIKRVAPQTAVVLLSASLDERLSVGAVEAGAFAFVPKSRVVEQLMEAIDRAVEAACRSTSRKISFRARIHA